MEGLRHVMERYNAVLSFHHVVENIDECMLLDNEALCNICFRTFSDDPHLRRSQPSRVRSGEWSQEVHSVLCPVELRSEQTGRHPHSLPSPSFLHQGASDVRGSQQYRALTMPDLTQHMPDPRNMMCAADPRHGRLLTAATLFRGRMSTKEVDEQMLYNKNSS